MHPKKFLRLATAITSAAGPFVRRAAILRDHLDNLSWFDRRMKALRTTERTFNGVLPTQTHKKRAAWLVLKGGRLVGSAAEPNRALTAIKRLSEISVQSKGSVYHPGFRPTPSRGQVCAGMTKSYRRDGDRQYPEKIDPWPAIMPLNKRRQLVYCVAYF